MAFEGLHIARSGILASQRALDVTGNNIANVGTPDYSRQRVQQVSTERAGASILLGPGANGTGVMITGVERIRDVLLDRGVRGEMANAAGSQTTATTLEHIETALGPLRGGLTDDLTAFWNSWEELSLDPASTTARQLVLDAGAQIGRSVRSMSTAVNEVVTATRGEAELVLEAQNGVLADVARLNGEIRAHTALGENPNALLDERDRLLDRMAENLGAKVHTLESGEIHVSVGGYALVRGDRTTTLGIAGTPPTLLTAEGHTLNPGGRLGALLVGAAAAAGQVQSDLDVLAISLRDAVNDQHRLGFDLDGAGGGDFFGGSGATDLDLAVGLDVRAIAASADGAARDGNNGIALAGVRSLGGPGGTIDETARAILGRVGAAVQTASHRAALGSTSLEGLRSARSAVNGVNLDEELTMLMQYQRSYEASARVMTSVDEMLDVLINRTGLVGR
ncbi:MAG: flagellar hook-associated protein FlgK [Acidimicrobiales bacterium]